MSGKKRKKQESRARGTDWARADKGFIREGDS
jgi:hypothetical protein